MSRNILLPHFLLPQSAVRLGRFVISLDEPSLDYHDPETTGNPDVSESIQTRYDSITRLSTDTGFNFELSRFLSSAFSRRAKAIVKVTADSSKSHYLANSGDWLRSAIKSTETKKWIERTIDEGEPIYVIVGYHTVVDAQITETAGRRKLTQGQLSFSVLDTLAASAMSLVRLNTIDPGLGSTHDYTEGEQRQFVAEGERVFAVQYRRLRYRWLSNKDLNAVTLAKSTVWKRYDVRRELQSDGRDSIEVNLQEVELPLVESEESLIGSEKFLSLHEVVDTVDPDSP